MLFAKVISTFLGIGYIQKGAGTVAALFYCVAWYFFRGGDANIQLQVALILVLFFLGVFVSSMVEREWGKDSNKVVIDEVLGMAVALFLIPVDIKFILISFLLFRFFDIVKPLYIKRAESLPGGWGVMLDDLLAGIYTNVLLHVVIKSHLF